jgi:hypothetical protein
MTTDKPIETIDLNVETTSPASESRELEVRLTALAAELDPNGTGVEEFSLPAIGHSIVRWIIALTIFVLLLIGMFGWFTYPHFQDVARLAEAGTELGAYREYQAAWFEQVKDLLQLLAAPFVALVSTLIGYIFGRRISGDRLRLDDRSPRAMRSDRTESMNPGRGPWQAWIIGKAEGLRQDLANARTRASETDLPLIELISADLDRAQASSRLKRWRRLADTWSGSSFETALAGLHRADEGLVLVQPSSAVLARYPDLRAAVKARLSVSDPRFDVFGRLLDGLETRAGLVGSDSTADSPQAKP